MHRSNYNLALAAQSAPPSSGDASGENPATPAKKASNPFGSARPVDTASKLAAVETKLHKDKPARDGKKEDPKAAPAAAPAAAAAAAPAPAGGAKKKEESKGAGNGFAGLEVEDD